VEEVADDSQAIEKMERETGVEPATSSLGSWHSTTELLPLAPATLVYQTPSRRHLAVAFANLVGYNIPTESPVPSEVAVAVG
jgi:hypothetical protein